MYVRPKLTFVSFFLCFFVHLLLTQNLMLLTYNSGDDKGRLYNGKSKSRERRTHKEVRRETISTGFFVLVLP